MAPAEAGRRRDAQMAARLDAAGADARLGAGQIGEQALAGLEKGAAFVREADAPRRAQEQLHAQALLERGDAPADDRRGHALGARGRRQAAPGDSGDERFDLREPVHGRKIKLSGARINDFPGK